MRAHTFLAGTIAVLVLSVASPGFAQNKDRDTCENDRGDARVPACTRLLNDRSLPIKDREKFLNERGVGYFRKKEWDSALADFSEALKINPRDNVLWANRADTYRNKKEFKLALEDSKKSIELNPKNKRNYYVRGLIYYDDNNYDFAIPEFGEAIQLDPKYDEAYYYRARSFFLKKDYKAAIPDFTESIGLDPKYAPTWFYRGLSYERLDDLDQALADYNQAITLDNGHGSARHNRGMIKLGRGDYDSAIEDFTVSIRTSADEITHNSRGVAYRNKGEFQLAMNDFNEAIRFDPKYARAYYNRGMLHSRAGATDLAVADLRKSVELDPKSKEARDALARAEAMLASAPRQSQQRPQQQQQQQAQPQSPAQALAALPQALQQQAQAPGTSQGGKRVALVIGNSNYQFSSKLANPGNDAQDIAQTLRQLGFDVVEGRDLDRRGMDDALRQYSRKLDGAGLAILFYSGHGVQVNERNYLIPIDARIERAADLNLDAVDVQRIIDQMEAEKRVNLIFLDACRDNPLTRSLRVASGTRSAAVGMGLAPVQSAAGTLIAYATQPNNVALDGDGRNSPFTTALLKHMVVPNLEVELMMKQVRLDVMAATREKQVPWGHSSLVGNVYLRQ